MLKLLHDNCINGIEPDFNKIKPPAILKMKRLLLVSVSIFLWSLSYSATSAVLLDAKTEIVNPVAELSVFADPTHNLTLKEVQSLPQNSFKKATNNHGNIINFGFSSDAYWLKLDLKKTLDAPKEWVVEVPYQGLSEIDFFAPGKPPVITGASRSIESRGLFHRYFAFPVDVETTPQTVYFRIRSSYSVTAPINIIERQAFIQETQKSLIAQFLYFGGIIALILYNFQLYLSLRDKSYLLYALFGLSMGLSIFSGNGFGRILLWPDAPAWDQVGQSVLISLAGTFSVLFARSHLKTKRCLPKFDPWLRILAVAYGLVAIGLISSLLHHHAQGFWHQALMLLTLPYFALITAASIKIFLIDKTRAKHFLVAWGFLCLAVIIATLRAFGLIPTNILTSYAIQIGTGFEMLLLSYALSYRIRIEQNKRAAAQQDALNAKFLLVESLQANEARLEKLVEERTHKLEASLANEKHLRAQYVRFSALISHEFRNPLNNIESQTDLLKREHMAGIDNLAKRTTVIFAATQQLSLLFDRWIKSDRVNKSLALETLTTISVNQWLQELIQRYEASQPNRPFVFTPSLPSLALQADESLLQIAVINLLDNACKYSPPTSRITVATIESGHEIGIEVHDGGEGIDPKYHQAIFEEGFRVSPRHPKHGAGLGLAFVKSIVDLHHARVSVCSRVGGGTLFTLWFPKHPTTH